MQTPAIEMKGITKIYPNGVVANKDVDFSVDSVSYTHLTLPTT